ncbi:hypothetical protein [Dyadobacter crusticola]|uniref:hypothetical protein n=1 Tax=Dyadobacter crusticola TaxID=292407 RepID=UPI0004E10629|nr:hypothetical protein [Dyadobacter crusticola]
MQKKKARLPFSLLSSLMMFIANVNAQNTLELVQDGTHNSFPPPIAKGPTSIPQTLHFFTNKDGAFDKGIMYQKPLNDLSVTVSLDDQTYTNVPQHVTGMTFGAGSGASVNHTKPAPILNTDYHYSDGSRTVFTAHPEGPKGEGVSLSANPGLQIFLSAKPLMLANAPKTDSSRYYYGKLRLEFSRPVSDPVISFAGLGATTNFGGKRLGFATEFALLSPSVQLYKLSGNEQLVIDQNQIVHRGAQITGDCDGGAACGSILFKGKQLTKIVLGVYLRSDGGPGVWGTSKVMNSGDMWHITVSLADQ